jgi:hypothetical protein
VRRWTGRISCPTIDWLNQLQPETRGDPSTNGNGRPGSELGLAVRLPVSAFRWCPEDCLADRARSAPVPVQPPRRHTRRAPRPRRARPSASASASVPSTAPDPVSLCRATMGSIRHHFPYIGASGKLNPDRPRSGPAPLTLPLAVRRQLAPPDQGFSCPYLIPRFETS